MGKTKIDREFMVRFVCREGKWAPSPSEYENRSREEFGGSEFDVFHVECVACGHRLRWNQTAWRIRHEFSGKCAPRAVRS